MLVCAVTFSEYSACHGGLHRLHCSALRSQVKWKRQDLCKATTAARTGQLEDDLPTIKNCGNLRDGIGFECVDVRMRRTLFIFIETCTQSCPGQVVG